MRGDGLRHICVVDGRNRVVGILSRKNFINLPSEVVLLSDSGSLETNARMQQAQHTRCTLATRAAGTDA